MKRGINPHFRGKSRVRLEAEEIQAVERAIEDIDIKIGSIREPRGIWSEPPSKSRIVKALPKKDKTVHRSF